MSVTVPGKRITFSSIISIIYQTRDILCIASVVNPIDYQLFAIIFLLLISLYASLQKFLLTKNVVLFTATKVQSRDQNESVSSAGFF